MLRKIFNMKDFRTTKLYIITVVISLALFSPTKMLVSRLIDPPFERWLESRREAKSQAFQEEVARRRAERKETDNNIVKTPHVSPEELVDTTDGTSTESTNMAELPQNSSDPPSRLLLSGPYKGMTPEEVRVFEQREREHIQRRTEYVEKFYQATNIHLENSDDKELLLLSVFKSLSPEQLKHAREEALKSLPAEDVNYFFDNVENKGTAMTDEQFIAESEQILTSDKALDIVFRELAIEDEELKQEYKELFGEESYNEVYGDE